jgi:hypothetical protein
MAIARRENVNIVTASHDDESDHALENLGIIPRTTTEEKLA